MLRALVRVSGHIPIQEKNPVVFLETLAKRAHKFDQFEFYLFIIELLEREYAYPGGETQERLDALRQTGRSDEAEKLCEKMESTRLDNGARP